MLTGIQDAHTAYVRALREVQLSDQEALGTALRDYQRLVQDAQDEYQQRAADAGAAHGGAAGGAGGGAGDGGDDDSGDDGGAYQEYTRELQRAWAEAQDRVTEAYQAYRDATAEVWEGSTEAHREAFREYVRAVQSELGGIDLDALSPQDLAHAAVAIHATAQYAASTPAATPGGGKGKARGATTAAGGGGGAAATRGGGSPSKGKK